MCTEAVHLYISTYTRLYNEIQGSMGGYEFRALGLGFYCEVRINFKQVAWDSSRYIGFRCTDA